MDLFNTKSFAIIGGKFYYDSLINNGTGSVLQANLDGSKQTTIVGGSNELGFTTDGKHIYYTNWREEEEDDFDEEPTLMNYNINSGKTNEEFLMWSKQMVKRDNTIFGIETTNGAPDRLVKVDLKTKKTKYPADDFFENYMNAMNVYGNELWFASDQLGEYGDEEEFDSYSNYDVRFYAVNTKTDKHMEEKDFTYSFTPEEIRLNEVNVPEDSKSLCFCIVDDKIYYKLMRSATDDNEGVQHVAPLFGRMNIDGTDNEIYGY